MHTPEMTKSAQDTIASFSTVLRVTVIKGLFSCFLIVVYSSTANIRVTIFLSELEGPEICVHSCRNSSPCTMFVFSYMHVRIINLPERQITSPVYYSNLLFCGYEVIMV